MEKLKMWLQTGGLNSRTGWVDGRPKPFLQDEDGIGTIELVLILVVLIGLVVIFRDSITDLLHTLFGKINGQAGKL